MRKGLQLLFAVLDALVIEAFLSTMVERALVVPGGDSIWARVGELAHLPGGMVGEALLGIKNPLLLFFRYASGLVIWFLACFTLLTMLFPRKSAEPGASPNAAPPHR